MTEELKIIRHLCYDRLGRLFPVGVPETASRRLESELSLLDTPERARPLLLYHKLSTTAAESGGAVKVLGGINGLFVLFLLGTSRCDPLPAHYYCGKCGHSEFPKTRLFGIDLPKKTCPCCGNAMDKDGYNLDVFSTRITEESYVPVMEYRVSSNFLNTARQITVAYARSSGRVILPLISGVDQDRPTRHVGYSILPDFKTPDDFRRYIDRDDNGELFVRHGEQDRHLSKQCGAERMLFFESRQLNASADKSKNFRWATELTVDELLQSHAFSDGEQNVLKGTIPKSFRKLCDLLTLSHCSFESKDGRLIQGKKVLYQDFFTQTPVYSSDDVFDYLAEHGFDRPAAHDISEHIRTGRGLRDPDTLYHLNAPDEIIELSKHCGYLWSRASMAEKIANMRMEWKEDYI